MSETWILLRGLSRGAGHWGGFADQARQALPGATVVALDLPGNGQRHRETSPARVAAMTEALRREVRGRELPGPVHLLAMSLGAMVACDWATRYPQELAGAVLINTSLRPFSPFWQRLRPAAYPRLLGLALGRAPAAAWEAAILDLTSQLAGDRQAVLADWIRLREQAPVSLANSLRQLRAAMHYRAPGIPPAVPLLLLAGAGDRLVDPACSRRLGRAWAAPLIEHPDSGHDLPLDAGPWVLAQVRAARDLWAAARAEPAQPSQCAGSS
jgi:pimeloyl-ACP methyl ester carboxylesterase